MTRINLAQPNVPASAYRVLNNARGAYSPRVNLIETDDDFKLEMAVPGIKKEEININYENGKLHVSYFSKPETVESSYVFREFSPQSFDKTFAVSAKKIDTETIIAKCEDGVLTLVLAKREEEKVKPAKQIVVS